MQFFFENFTIDFLFLFLIGNNTCIQKVFYRFVFKYSDNFVNEKHEYKLLLNNE